jgi:hypothetical protein
MQQVRIFKTVETDLPNLEKQINEWVRETGVQILSITGNVAPQSGGTERKATTLGTSHFAASDVLLIVLYETPSA